MKPEERIAQAYLQEELANIVYEPNGNVPPDFSVEGTIGVEVRRLNEHLFAPQTQGLETDRIRLGQSISRVLQEFDAPAAPDTYWIGFTFQRPVSNLRGIQGTLRTELQTFFAQGLHMPHIIDLGRNTYVRIARRVSVSGSPRFTIAYVTDNDSGGMIAELYIDNVQHCIDEKTRKIQKYLSQYAEWWLLLVDAIGGGFLPFEVTEILGNLRKPNEWSRIVVIDPVTLDKMIEI